MTFETLNNTAYLAEADFLACCGSEKWARLMTNARPFADFGELLSTAAQIWQSLEAADWLQAFAAHPKIGSKKSAPNQPERSINWSGKEQSGMQTATDTVRIDLDAANRLYEEKFGYIFIVCATGKSAQEMLDQCRERITNTPDEELQIAAEEQRKITEIRLKNLTHG